MSEKRFDVQAHFDVRGHTSVITGAVGKGGKGACFADTTRFFMMCPQ